MAALTVGFMLSATPALADSATSSNWSGYAVYRSRVAFRSVAARWRVPSVSCSAGSPAYSAMWVGLGGYSETSTGLEQTGTESDCSASGKAYYWAWFEILPATSTQIALGVRAGDLISARVRVIDRRVTIVLADLTAGRTFAKTLYPRSVDTTSAEWILEAPSECDDSGACTTLPLADFARAAFSFAHARTAGGHNGAIRSTWWETTKITLASGERQFVSTSGIGSSVEALPSRLSSNGSRFSVVYRSDG